MILLRRKNRFYYIIGPQKFLVFNIGIWRTGTRTESSRLGDELYLYGRIMMIYIYMMNYIYMNVL